MTPKEILKSVLRSKISHAAKCHFTGLWLDTGFCESSDMPGGALTPGLRIAVRSDLADELLATGMVVLDNDLVDENGVMIAKSLGFDYSKLDEHHVLRVMWAKTVSRFSPADTRDNIDTSPDPFLP